MSQTQTSRRTVLTGIVAAAAGAPLLNTFTITPAHAADNYPSNTDLYDKTKEGKDFARRFKRHEMVDPDKDTPRLTTVMAIHGGGIEPGTSELCLAIAGYRPDTLTPVTPGTALHDYWMLEGLRAPSSSPQAPGGNRELHVKSTHNDDPVARSMAAGSANVLSIHGCTTDSAKLPKGAKAVLVGGANGRMRQLLSKELSQAGFDIAIGELEDLNGDRPENICNRTLTGEGGAQLELTTELRQSLFDDFSGATKRSKTTKPEFWTFVQACRIALAQMESEQLARDSIFNYTIPG
ncbi:poly-gamma-glutamate hydrolase family protein [Streptomyces sp. NPDC127084]|uniref:poly-gamma-glutamate hydrolase family protein n=1 Tax=Streptomyces sp. NPDC127084 TaxID=3347133 RepID=UPI00366104EE